MFVNQINYDFQSAMLKVELTWHSKLSLCLLLTENLHMICKNHFDTTNVHTKRTAYDVIWSTMLRQTFISHHIRTKKKNGGALQSYAHYVGDNVFQNW